MVITKLINKLQEVVINEQHNVIKEQDKVLKRNEMLLDVDKKLGSFSVAIDNIYLAQGLVNLAQQHGLSVQPGNVIINDDGTSILAFGFDDQYDVIYLQHPEQALLGNCKPVFSASNDFYKLERKVVALANLKKEYTFSAADKKKTVRTLYLEKNSIAQRIKNGLDDLSDNMEKAFKKQQKKEENVVVEVYDHFIQIGTRIIPKNPNDRIRKIKVNYI